MLESPTRLMQASEQETCQDRENKLAKTEAFFFVVFIQTSNRRCGLDQGVSLQSSGLKVSAPSSEIEIISGPSYFKILNQAENSHRCVQTGLSFSNYQIGRIAPSSSRQENYLSWTHDSECNEASVVCLHNEPRCVSKTGTKTHWTAWQGLHHYFFLCPPRHALNRDKPSRTLNI